MLCQNGDQIQILEVKNGQTVKTIGQVCIRVEACMSLGKCVWNIIHISFSCSYFIFIYFL